MFRSIARFSVKFRWPIIIFWIALVPIFTATFPKLNDVEKNNTSDFLPKNSVTATGASLENSFKKSDTATNSILIVGKTGGQLDVQDDAATAALLANIKSIKDVTEIRDLGYSHDHQAREWFVGLSGKGFGPGAADLVKNVRQAITKTNLPNGLQAHLTGDLAASVDQESANNKGRNQTEQYSVLLILVLLLFVFRSILAPLVTLLPALLALLIAQPVIAESTKIGVQVGFITQIMLIILLLGAGTDYGLFLIFRVREEMRKGLKAKEAVVEALSHVGESITFSAATVIAAVLSLMLATFGLYKGLGPALAIGLGIMLLIALTFLPALISVLGGVVFWPSKTNKQDLRIGLWGRLADRAIKKPILVLCFGVILFGGLGLGLAGYKGSGFGTPSAPAGTDSAAGEKILKQHFPAANDSPQLLIFKLKNPVWENPDVIAKAQSQLMASGQFRAISGPLDYNGTKITPRQLLAPHARGGQAGQALSQFISADGKTIQFYGVLSAGPSGSTAALRATPNVTAAVTKAAKDISAEQSSDYSSDVAAYDINRTTNSDLKRIIPIVLIIIAILLALLLRSLVAPWYLIISVGLSYIASLGFAMILFVHILGHDGLNFVLPFLMFVFGMALGEDYNILVMSRIREEARQEKSLFKAITKAVGITGTTVTSAGLILAGTFSIFGLVGGGVQGEQIGYGIAFAILLDTFFVRTLLVPSIVAMLGKWNWWPSKLTSR